ncbi:hypothetical protein ACI68E_000441 [Malassezia pachydermatis]|uniref:Uncharacterized protein n=1 Tax=Malassezia pachydermatis TaxID=77020 RepID=A0A0N0RSI8_9BASI|nr:hypothetical protein Malapachy_2254 [Malassezia pachydermatis]KOS15195.1 hypothetical protein Malapachy_2254 [Malassezia pachydermatis]
MDLWRPTLLGHRSIPALWQQGMSRIGASEEKLGDVQKTPTSIQVYNAYLFDKLRQRSTDCGLGLVEAEETFHRAAPQIKQDSMRMYASKRIEHEKFVFETIQGATDVDRILWEAQMAYMAQRYALAAVLLRRASDLESEYACIFLAKMFGLGLSRSNVVLFERDTLRGIAWALCGLQLLLASIEQQRDATKVHMLSQTLTLLSTLVCAPEALQMLRTDDKHADIAWSLLLLFPRSCELLHPEARLQNCMPSEPTRESIWSAMRDALTRVAAFEARAELDELTEHTMPDVDLVRIHLGVLFLEAYLIMRNAIKEKEPMLVQDTYTAWSRYLQEGRDRATQLNLTPFRRVASEGQQWSAPDLERKMSATLSNAEVSALSCRISRIFPFSGTQKKASAVKAPPLKDSTNYMQKVVPERRAGRAPSVSSRKSVMFAEPSRPQLLSRVSTSSASFTPSSDQALSQTTQRYDGITSSRLRSVPGIPQRQAASTDSSVGTPGACLMPDEPSYLSRMHDDIPSSRKRTSSIVSVTPSLMFPVKGQVDVVPTLMDTTTGFSPSEMVHSTRASSALDENDRNSLRSRLKRQSSQASIRTVAGFR